MNYSQVKRETTRIKDFSSKKGLGLWAEISADQINELPQLRKKLEENK